jgi:hypothetical protein
MIVSDRVPRLNQTLLDGFVPLVNITMGKRTFSGLFKSIDVILCHADRDFKIVSVDTLRDIHKPPAVSLASASLRASDIV